MSHLILDHTEYNPLRKYAMLTYPFLPSQGQPDTMLYHLKKKKSTTTATTTQTSAGREHVKWGKYFLFEQAFALILVSER